MTTALFPDGLGLRLRFQLERDLFVFGTAFYEDTDGGYERLDPLEVTIGASGLPDDVAGVADKAPTDYYGTPPITLEVP